MRLYEFNYFSCRYFVRNKSLVFSSPLTLAWKSYNLKQNISDTQKLMSKIPTLPIKLKQPRRRQQQNPPKFAYFKMKNSIFARFARAFFICWHFGDVLVLSTTLNDLFCSCVDDVSIWWRMFNFVFLCPKHWLQFNFRTVRTHFSSIITLNNWKIISETQLHFQMTFSLPSTSCLLKLRIHYLAKPQPINDCSESAHWIWNLSFNKR